MFCSAGHRAWARQPLRRSSPRSSTPPCGRHPGRHCSTLATSRRSCPACSPGRCCSSTKFTEQREPPKKCCTWRWRTFVWTSSSARARVRRLFLWTSSPSPLSEPQRGRECCPGRCEIDSGSPLTSTSMRLPILSTSCTAALVCSTSTSPTREARRSLAGAAAPRELPTDCCGGSGIGPKCTAMESSTWTRRELPWSYTRWMWSAWIGSIVPFSRRSSTASVAVRWD